MNFFSNFVCCCGFHRGNWYKDFDIRIIITCIQSRKFPHLFTCTQLNNRFSKIHTVQRIGEYDINQRINVDVQ